MSGYGPQAVAILFYDGEELLHRRRVHSECLWGQRHRDSLLLTDSIVATMNTRLRTVLPLLAGLLATAVATAGCSELLSEDAPEEKLAQEEVLAADLCTSPAPLKGDRAEGPASYLVVFKYEEGRDTEALVSEMADEIGFEPTRVYTAALQGFAAELAPEALAGVRCAPPVDYVERDGTVSTQ